MPLAPRHRTPMASAPTNSAPLPASHNAAPPPSSTPSAPSVLTATAASASTSTSTTTHFSKRRNSPPSSVASSLPSALTLLGLVLLALSFALDYPSSSLVSSLRAPLTLPSSSMGHSSRVVARPPSTKPPSKKELGQAGWTLIHSIAANFPPEPTDYDRYYAKMFLKSIAKLYPCKRCRSHFDRYLVSSPPDLSTRDSFVLWACEAHNDVNRRNGKPEFPCQLTPLDARWGDCGCKRAK